MIDQFRQVFLDEAEELLAELEIALLELEQRPRDRDLVDRIFRALHTIKGSSSMFGFDRVALFSHEMETVFSLVRDGGIGVSSELVVLTLQARDLVREMLKVSPVDGEPDESQLDEVVAALRLFAGVVEAVPLTEAPCSVEPGGLPDSGPEITYAIHFCPDRDIFRRGLNPGQLLNELRDLGPCRITAHTDGIPPLADLDPELCYLSWDITLCTAQGVDAIHDIFMFIGEESKLEISVIVPEEAAGSPSGMTRHVEDPEPRNGRDTQGTKGIANIRVPAEKLDQLVNLVGELVTAQARLSQIAVGHNDAWLITLAEEIERLTEGLRDTALNIRMIPIGGTFSRLRRLVHDLAHELGKDVELVTEGVETELDKTVIERLTDPLVHLIRNSVDHGIETPEIRLAAGKALRGTIRLSAAHSGDSVLLTLSDDGAGIDLESLRARGLQKGLITAGTEYSDRELLNLIFTPGFSTSTKITSISGRGVGMDVVKRGVDALRGAISLSSNQGEGTTVTIRIPLTLAIIESLLVRIGSEHYVLPLSMVEECIELTRLDLAMAHGRQLVNVRGAIVPYIPLRERFGISGIRPEREQIVIVEVDGKRIGLVVDHVIGGHQTVIKSIGRMFREVSGVSGATILGDGSVALILDVLQLVSEEEHAERVNTCSETQFMEKRTTYA
jgi:two-component system, chemotaxis family, sensor kinase CheA